MSEFKIQPDTAPEPPPGIGDAAWAHNRWPAVGLWAGAGFGLILGMVLLAGWWTILYVIGLAVGGCYCGLLAATVMYRQLLKREHPDRSGGGAVVGIIAGAGIGLVLGLTLNAGWVQTMLYMAGCAVVTAAVTFIVARWMSRSD